MGCVLLWEQGAGGSNPLTPTMISMGYETDRTYLKVGQMRQVGTCSIFDPEGASGYLDGTLEQGGSSVAARPTGF